MSQTKDKKNSDLCNAVQNVDKFINLVNQKKDNSLTSFIETGQSKEGKEALSHIDDLDNQMNVFKDFKDGKIDYATMRMHCG